ncbi:hypothetical protein HWV62_14974 [Athelia sp. TMB]|nr:hypothetical protein HWV62_14974 [Athelia sp. TMB]
MWIAVDNRRGLGGLERALESTPTSDTAGDEAEAETKADALLPLGTDAALDVLALEHGGLLEGPQALEPTFSTCQCGECWRELSRETDDAMTSIVDEPERIPGPDRVLDLYAPVCPHSCSPCWLWCKLVVVRSITGVVADGLPVWATTPLEMVSFSLSEHPDR